MKLQLAFYLFTMAVFMAAFAGAEPRPKRPRPRELGIRFGEMKPGPLNAITDVAGVRVGHVTLRRGDDVRTGVTAVLPHGGNLYQEKVPAAIHLGNGYGKLAGYTQVRELGEIESPIVLSNTLATGAAVEGGVRWLISLPGNEELMSVNVVAGECNDGRLSDIRGLHVRPEHVLEAIRAAKDGPVEEGNVGGGTGTICHGFKGGIGTASRVIATPRGTFVLGVLAQTNFGAGLDIDGVPVGRILAQETKARQAGESGAGSCMVVVATDAPVDALNLRRLGQRVMMGLALTGSVSTNSSGDYAVAFSTATELRRRHGAPLVGGPALNGPEMNPVFMATVEATEEAVINSIFAAEDMTGRGGTTVKALPIDSALRILREYRHL